MRGATGAVELFAGDKGCFNPRARAGRDALKVNPYGLVCLFQPTRPCGARPGYQVNENTAAVFQPTRPCGARRVLPPSSPSRLMFQPTRPCGARPNFSNKLCVTTNVSTHAPVRGATNDLPAFQSSQVKVSTHAPVRGATFIRPL